MASPRKLSRPRSCQNESCKRAPGRVKTNLATRTGLGLLDAGLPAIVAAGTLALGQWFSFHGLHITTMIRDCKHYFQLSFSPANSRHALQSYKTFSAWATAAKEIVGLVQIRVLEWLNAAMQKGVRVAFPYGFV